MRRFWTALLAITLASHLPFGAALWFALGRLGVPWAGAVATVVSLALVSMLRGRLQRALADRPTPAWWVRLVEEPWYAHWCATVATWPALVIAGLALGAHAAWAGAAGLGARLGAAALACYGAALLLGLYGVMIRRRWVRVRTLDVEVAGLGDRFDGYRIAHLSDLHIGGLWPAAAAERWCRAVAALDVDLVALTGDYVTHGDAFHEEVASVLSRLPARDGAVAVMGNHDYFGDGEALAALLRARGVTVLSNESTSVSRGDQGLTVAGVDDTWSRRADVGRALHGVTPGQPVIALAHDPQLFPALARGGAALVLSGHTHWGQIALPFWPTRFNLSRLSYRFHAGTYREGPAVLYVSPGLGTTGPPVRLGAPPEITVLRLRAARPA